MTACDSLRAVFLAGLMAVAIDGQAVAQNDAVQQDAKVDKAIVDRSRAYMKDKQARHFNRAYAMIAASMRSYLTPALFESEADRFLSEAGKPGDMRFTKVSWYRDPPEASEPGLYVAVDFTGTYANLELMCGYLMWRQGTDGQFQLVREEQNFIDRHGAQQMVPEQRQKLPDLFGCVSP
ncbi:MAG: hypothetical protein JWR77_1656 [Rhizorhabdus sp.]|nr:hypothetical protein [Rhizorhabdus sp.]